METFTAKPHMCFEVEKVIGVSSDGSYQVQWAPAWVSRFHLVGCEHLIQEFLQQQVQKELLQQQNESNVQPPYTPYNSNDPFSQHATDVNLHSRDSAGTVKEISTQQPVYSDDGNITNSRGSHEKAFINLETSLDGSFTADYSVNGPDEQVISSRPQSVDISLKLEEDDDELTTGVASSDLHYSSTAPESIGTTMKIGEYDESTIQETSNDHQCSSNVIDNENVLIPAVVCEQPPGKQLENSEDDTENFHNMKFSKKHVCSLCKKQFRRKSTLEKHSCVHDHYQSTTDSMAGENNIRTHRNKNGQYICQYCSRTLKNVNEFTRHCRIHTGEKPYHCSFCQKTFAESGNLNKHLRIHTGERPFSCDKCAESFHYKHHLERHKKKH